MVVELFIVFKYNEVNKTIFEGEASKMKKFSYLFVALAVLLSDIMCAMVAYNYRAMLCGIEHAGFSAPASTAFLGAIPYIIGIVVCAVLARALHKKSK